MQNAVTTPTEEAIALYHRYLKLREEFLAVEQQLHIALRNPQMDYEAYRKGINEARR